MEIQVSPVPNSKTSQSRHLWRKRFVHYYHTIIAGVCRETQIRQP
jgi:hypothetical protein